jgi:methionyl-tRNA formyltransferase
LLRIVVVGYGEMFTNLIAAALDAECEVVGVMRKDMIKYPKLIRMLKDLFNPSIEYNYIKSYNLHEIVANGVNTKEFRKQLLTLNPDILLVGSWGEKFKKETFNLPKIASINAHPSLLPKYRGPNPYFWVIKNQEEKTGISFHLIDDNYDTGAIIAQEEIVINPNDTGDSLKKRTVLIARGVARELLKTLNEDIIIPLQQREEISSYYSHPEGLMLDFTKSAEENHAIIRAIHPWGKAWFYHKSVPICPTHSQIMIEPNDGNHIEAGTIVNINSKERMIAVLCGNNKILKMSGVELYKSYDKPFTSNYISREIKVGEIL